MYNCWKDAKMLGNKYGPALSAAFPSCELGDRESVYGELLAVASGRFDMIL